MRTNEMEQTTVLPFNARDIVGVLLGLILLGCVTEAAAEPLFRVTLPEGAVITLHSGKCEMTEVVNLPMVATWEEKGKTFTGCWGVNPAGVVSLYFTDKTVVGLPVRAFEKVIGV